MSISPSQKLGAVLELLFAANIWGFGFIATRWALESSPPIWLNSIRFSLAGIVGLILLYCFRSSRKHLTRKNLLQAAVPGLLLTGSILFQTVGLQWTTVMKSSFITTLYVLIVPFMEALWLRRKISALHYFFVGLALVGTAMICGGKLNDLNLNWGDVLTFLCAIFAAFHIVQLETIQTKIVSPFAFNVYQALWAGFSATCIAVFMEGLPTLPKASGFYSILYLSFCSTLVAFLIQVRAQKVITPSVVSLLFLLESPFATLYGFWIFDEPISWTQGSGAVLILLASAGAALTHLYLEKKTAEGLTIH